jgi:hypothetical protein
MNPEIKQQWLKALRSGEYEQDTSSLRTTCGFCCLGVLTDLYLKEHNKEWIEDKMFPFYYYRDESKILPLDVMCWAGLLESNPFLATRHSLAHYNDNLGYNFEQIADLIEEQL